jgi:hypothetical protein
VSDEIPSENRPLPKLDDEWSAHPALAAWLFQNPENERQFHRWREQIEQHNDWSAVPADLHEDVKFAIRKWRNRQLLLTVGEKVKAVADLLSDESLPMKERIKQSKPLMDEVNDALLDTPEPHRSRFLKDFLPRWEAILNSKENLP